MKRALILLAILGLAATPVMAKTKLEAPKAKTHVTTKHVKATKHQKKLQKKKLKKKLAKRSTRKHKIAV